MKGRLYMTYTSLGFYVFIIILLFFYYIMPLKSRWVVLLAGSLSFYFIIIPWFIIKNGNFIIVSIFNGNSISWVVPMGISFYTLQIVSYLTDIYTGKIKPQRNFVKFALFVLFFPQIVQGPMPRYKQLGEQLYTGHLFNEHTFAKGCQMVLWGFFLYDCR